MQQVLHVGSTLHLKVWNLADLPSCTHSAYFEGAREGLAAVGCLTFRLCAYTVSGAYSQALERVAGRSLQVGPDKKVVSKHAVRTTQAIGQLELNSTTHSQTHSKLVSRWRLRARDPAVIWSSVAQLSVDIS